MSFFEVGNDPLMDNIFDIQNGLRLLPLNEKKTFQLDYSQFMQLIRNSYETISILDEDFVRDISFGVFQYYCVLLLWMRLYFVISERGYKTIEMSDLNKTLNFKLPVPSDIKLYLQGIGDLKDSNGLKYMIDIQGSLSYLEINGAQGSYGKMDASNFIIYETLPSLLISLLKIEADMNQYVFDWNLPAILKPNLSSALTPNRNLLGWWPAEKLTSEQDSVLANAKITYNSFNVVNIGFLPINVLLIKYVAQKLEESNMAWDIMPPFTYGSIAQVAFTSRAFEDASIYGRRNIAGKFGRTNSFIPMPKHVSIAAATFRYRLKRFEMGLSDMVGYEFSSNEIPVEILDNENQIFEFGVGSELWQGSDYRISEQNGHFLINSFSIKLRKKHEESIMLAASTPH